MFSSAETVLLSCERVAMVLGRLVCISRPDATEILGIVESYQNPHFFVKYEDNTSEIFAATEISRYLVKCLLGKRVRKYFWGNGVFEGTVVSFDGTFYSVKYDDGDCESYPESALKRLLTCSYWHASGCTASSLFSIGESVIAFNENFYEATILGKQVSPKHLLIISITILKLKVSTWYYRVRFPVWSYVNDAWVSEDYIMRDGAESRGIMYSSVNTFSTSPKQLGRIICTSRPAYGDTIGVIEAFNSPYFVVNFEDGGSENITEYDIQCLFVHSLLGKRVRKFFRNHGVFEGSVNSFEHPFYLVKYDDGDVEAYPESSLQRLLICSRWHRDGCTARALFTVEEKVIAFQGIYYPSTIIGKQLTHQSWYYCVRFPAWSGNHDAYVSEDFIMKDTPDSREILHSEINTLSKKPLQNGISAEADKMPIKKQAPSTRGHIASKTANMSTAAGSRGTSRRKKGQASAVKARAQGEATSVFSLTSRSSSEVESGQTNTGTGISSSSQPASLVGRYICKSFDESGVFVGKVESYEDSLYHVIYDDGDSEDFAEQDSIRKFMEECFVGQRVRKSLGHAGFLEGVIVAYKNKLYTIRYEDGSLRTCGEERMVARLVCRRRHGFIGGMNAPATQTTTQQSVAPECTRQCENEDDVTEEEAALFALEERVYAYDGATYYKAKILKREKYEKVWNYFIHFCNWSHNHDGWVSEDFILRDNQAALEIFRLQELQRDKRVNQPACANRSQGPKTSNTTTKATASAVQKPRKFNRKTSPATTPKLSSDGSGGSTNTSAHKRASVSRAQSLLGRYICKPIGKGGICVGIVESFEAPYYRVKFQKEEEQYTEHCYKQDALLGRIGKCFIGQSVQVPNEDGTSRDGVITGFSDKSYYITCADDRHVLTVSEEELVGMLTRCTVGETVVVKDAGSFLRGKVMKVETLRNGSRVYFMEPSEQEENNSTDVDTASLHIRQLRNKKVSRYPSFASQDTCHVVEDELCDTNGFDHSEISEFVDLFEIADGDVDFGRDTELPEKMGHSGVGMDEVAVYPAFDDDWADNIDIITLSLPNHAADCDNDGDDEDMCLIELSCDELYDDGRFDGDEKPMEKSDDMCVEADVGLNTASGTISHRKEDCDNPSVLAPEINEQTNAYPISLADPTRTLLNSHLADSVSRCAVLSDGVSLEPAGAALSGDSKITQLCDDEDVTGVCLNTKSPVEPYIQNEICSVSSLPDVHIIDSMEMSNDTEWCRLVALPATTGQDGTNACVAAVLDDLFDKVLTGVGSNDNMSFYGSTAPHDAAQASDSHDSMVKSVEVIEYATHEKNIDVNEPWLDRMEEDGTCEDAEDVIPPKREVKVQLHQSMPTTSVQSVEDFGGMEQDIADLIPAHSETTVCREDVTELVDRADSVDNNGITYDHKTSESNDIECLLSRSQSETEVCWKSICTLDLASEIANSSIAIIEEIVHEIVNTSIAHDIGVDISLTKKCPQEMIVPVVLCNPKITVTTVEETGMNADIIHEMVPVKEISIGIKGTCTESVSGCDEARDRDASTASQCDSEITGVDDMRDSPTQFIPPASSIVSIDTTGVDNGLRSLGHEEPESIHLDALDERCLKSNGVVLTSQNAEEFCEFEVEEEIEGGDYSAACGDKSGIYYETDENNLAHASSEDGDVLEDEEINWDGGTYTDENMSSKHEYGTPIDTDLKSLKMFHSILSGCRVGENEYSGNGTHKRSFNSISNTLSMATSSASSEHDVKEVGKVDKCRVDIAQSDSSDVSDADTILGRSQHDVDNEVIDLCSDSDSHENSIHEKEFPSQGIPPKMKHSSQSKAKQQTDVRCVVVLYSDDEKDVNEPCTARSVPVISLSSDSDNDKDDISVTAHHVMTTSRTSKVRRGTASKRHSEAKSTSSSTYVFRSINQRRAEELAACERGEIPDYWESSDGESSTGDASDDSYSDEFRSEGKQPPREEIHKRKRLAFSSRPISSSSCKTEHGADEDDGFKMGNAAIVFTRRSLKTVRIMSSMRKNKTPSSASLSNVPFPGAYLLPERSQSTEKIQSHAKNDSSDEENGAKVADKKLQERRGSVGKCTALNTKPDVPVKRSSQSLLNRFICKSFLEDGVFVGKVTDVKHGVCTIHYDDQEISTLPQEEVEGMLGSCFVGQRVLKGTGRGRREGVVVAYNQSDCTYQVQYMPQASVIVVMSEVAMVEELTCRHRCEYESARFEVGETVYANDGIKYGSSTVLAVTRDGTKVWNYLICADAWRNWHKAHETSICEDYILKDFYPTHKLLEAQCWRIKTELAPSSLPVQRKTQSLPKRTSSLAAVSAPAPQARVKRPISYHSVPESASSATGNTLIGSSFSKTFESASFTGTVIAYRSPYYHVQYEDGDSEDMSEDEMRSLMNLSPVDRAVPKRRRRVSTGSESGQRRQSMQDEWQGSDVVDVPWRVAGAAGLNEVAGMRFAGPAVIELESLTTVCKVGTFADAIFGSRMSILKSSSKAPSVVYFDKYGNRNELLSIKRHDEFKNYGGRAFTKYLMSYYFVATSGHNLENLCLQGHLESIADFASLENSRKVQSRLELFNSTATSKSKPCKLFVRDIELIEENISKVNGESMGDGCGFIGLHMLERLLGVAEAAKCLGVQVRLFGPQIGIYKGMLCKKLGIDHIQLPSSMRKVPPSKVATATDTWVYIMIVRSSPSKTAKEYHKILSGGTACPSFEMKSLSRMMQRVWETLGASESVIDTYLREKYPKHNWIVGLADPTGLIPADHVFVTGLKNCPSKVFVTRSPCVRAQDGRLLKTMITRPRFMSSVTWDWLQDLSFGAIIFSTAGNGMPIPMICAEGDLDGDLYFVCWDENIICSLKQRSLSHVLYTPTQPKQQSKSSRNPNWLRDAQAHMTDPSAKEEYAFIGKLYKEMEKLHVSSPQGMDDPDAIAYANAYVNALNRGKHGVEIGLPRHLRASVGL